MSLGLLAHSPTGELIYKTGTGDLAYKGTEVPEPPTPSPTSGDGWYFRSAWGVFLTNMIDLFENTGYEEGEYVREYSASNVSAYKTLTGNTIYQYQNIGVIGEWRDDLNPHSYPYFWTRENTLLPYANSEGTLEFEVTGVQPGSYPTWLFDVYRISISSITVDTYVNIPISAYIANGPHPIVCSGYVVFERVRY